MSMTKHIHVTNLLEIKTVTLRCEDCGWSNRVPVGSSVMPEMCPNCRTRVNLTPVVDLLRAVCNLNADTKRRVAIEIETEEAAGKN